MLLQQIQGSTWVSKIHFESMCQILKLSHTSLLQSIYVEEILINQCHLFHFNDKTSFCQSLDKRVYVKMSLDKKGYIACPFCHFLRHVQYCTPLRFFALTENQGLFTGLSMYTTVIPGVLNNLCCACRGIANGYWTQGVPKKNTVL